jgi:hypothetical protein
LHRITFNAARAGSSRSEPRASPGIGVTDTFLADLYGGCRMGKVYADAV